MKRFLAALLAVTLVMSASVTAFGATKKEAESKIESAAAFVEEAYGADGFAISESRQFEWLINSGADVSDYTEDYLQAAREELKKVSETMDTAVQLFAVFEALGEYPQDYSADSIKSILKSSEPVISSPYNYVEAISVSLAYDLPEVASACADALCKLYVMGTGAVFWGNAEWMSGDDNAMFIIALAPLAEDYADYIDDALTVLASYRSDDGYINSYTGANTDTTALALAAFSAIGEKELADEAYAMLTDNFFNPETGGFIADYNAAYSTAEALFAMTLYLDLANEFEDGWQCIDGVWRYFREDGTTREGWAKDGNKWYYTDSEGVAMKGWIKDNNKWCYLDFNGIMQTGLQQIGKNWYFFNGDGAMRTGWQKNANNWYYFNRSGAMQTGWVKDGGKWYFLSNSGTISTGYGTMKTGWIKDSGKWYFLDRNGAMKTGWIKDSGKWYYLNNDGAMRTANLTYKGKVYKFNSSGACLNP